MPKHQKRSEKELKEAKKMKKKIQKDKKIEKEENLKREIIRAEKERIELENKCEIPDALSEKTEEEPEVNPDFNVGDFLAEAKVEEEKPVEAAAAEAVPAPATQVPLKKIENFVRWFKKNGGVTNVEVREEIDCRGLFTGSSTKQNDLLI